MRKKIILLVISCSLLLVIFQSQLIVSKNPSSDEISASAINYKVNSGPFNVTLLSNVILGRQSYAGQHIMWNDSSGHINIINSFGGADVYGNETTYIHYINTFTGNSSLVEGGRCSFGRAGKVIYDRYNNKIYWGGEYCDNNFGGSFNEFDPENMSNRVLLEGNYTWFTTMRITMGADHKIYFTPMNIDYYLGNGQHLYQYDPSIENWSDYGVIYGPATGSNPAGLAIDLEYIYAGWQDSTPGANYHLMIHPINVSANWTEFNFTDNQTANKMFMKMDKNNLSWFIGRSTDGGSTYQYYWLVNGTAMLANSTPDSGYQYIEDVNENGVISMMGYGDYGMFNSAYNYDMNWDNLIPNPSSTISEVYYGNHSTWDYPNSGFSNSSLSYSGPWYELPISSIVPYTSSKFYALGDSLSDYNYTNSTGVPISLGAMPSAYYALFVPKEFSPIGVDEIYYSGYPNAFYRWNPSSPRNGSNPISLSSRFLQSANYRVFMDYDVNGTIWVGSNVCGASTPCTDYGTLAWYNPFNGSTGDIFNGTWTGGSGGGNGIQYRNFAISNNRTKIIVSSNDGNLTVINAINKSIEGYYSLSANAWMTEISYDRVIGVTTTSDPLGERVFLFSPSTRSMIIAPKSINVSGNTFGAGDGHIARRDFKLESGPDGYAWLFVDDKVFRINPNNLSFEHVYTDTSEMNKLKWGKDNQTLLLYGQSDVIAISGILNYSLDAECGTEKNICEFGILNDSIDNSTDYLWVCFGQNGGQDASCRKNIIEDTNNPSHKSAGGSGGSNSNTNSNKTNPTNYSNISMPIENGSLINESLSELTNRYLNENTINNEKKLTTNKTIIWVGCIILALFVTFYFYRTKKRNISELNPNT